LISLPGNNVVDYGMTKDELTEITVIFLLRGLGLTKAAIDRQYNPKELKNIIRRLAPERP